MAGENGAKQKIMHGGRAQLVIEGKIVGVFTSCQWNVQYDAQPSYILGRYSPAEITYTGSEPVSITATGFRVVDKGAFVSAGLPKLQELMGYGEVTLAVSDRQTGKAIMTVIGVKPTGFSTGVASRSVSDFTVNFLGRILSEEDGDQQEGGSSGSLPPTDMLSGS